MRRKIAAGLIVLAMAVSGCGASDDSTNSQVSGQSEIENKSETSIETLDLGDDKSEGMTAADSGIEGNNEDIADDAESDDIDNEANAEDDGTVIEGNGSYFVRIGTDVYFRTYEQEAFADQGMDGVFLPYAFAGGDTSALCRYDEKTGEVSEIVRDGCTGKLYFCGDRFYYNNVRDATVWTAIPDGEYGLFCPGNVAGISENGEYIALWVDIGDDPKYIFVYDSNGDECNFLSTFEFMQVIFCGVTDEGNIIFIGTDKNEETGLYSCIAGLPSEIVYLGEIPLENIFVDISCDRFFTRGEDVYCVIGYYGGPVLIMESYLYVTAHADSQGSMEVLEQGERNEAIFDEPLYLTHSIFGSCWQRQFLYGDLLYRDDNMQEKVLVKDFIPYEESERLIMQTGEVLGDYAYICVAEAERVPEDDYMVFRGYSYKDMYYLRIPLDGSGEVESIYGASWDNAGG